MNEMKMCIINTIFQRFFPERFKKIKMYNHFHYSTSGRASKKPEGFGEIQSVARSIFSALSRTYKRQTPE